MAKIADLLRGEKTLSFEFSAPRDSDGMQRLRRVLPRLAELQPSFMSVTYGAGGSTRGPTAEVVSHIQHELGVAAMPHLTCVAHTREEIATIIDRYRADGIENLLALRGDLPPGTNDLPSGHFRFALELAHLARERGEFSIAVAAHPEGHPMAESPESDLEHHAAKLAAADFAITQFFFRAEYYERFVEKLARRGVRTPVIAGVMPPTNAESVARMSAANATEFPPEIRRRLEAAGDDVAARRAIGVEVATRLCEELLALGAPGLHIYTMNFAEAPLAIVRGLGLR
jgi:methylenetetrahydrofolate reductase (NADPH)